MASPAATSRTARKMSAGGVSFSRNPLAPARSAPNTYSSRWKVVSTITCGGSGSAAIRPVAVIPSTPGIRTSISTTSGRWLPVAVTAAAPSAASPTTSRSLGGGQDHPQPGAHQRVVIDEQHPHRRLAAARSAPVTAAIAAPR